MNTIRVLKQFGPDVGLQKLSADNKSHPYFVIASKERVKLE